MNAPNPTMDCQLRSPNLKGPTFDCWQSGSLSSPRMTSTQHELSFGPRDRVRQWVGGEVPWNGLSSWGQPLNEEEIANKESHRHICTTFH